MRDCSALIDELKKHPEDYKFLSDTIKIVDDDGNQKYFLGIRNNSLKLYYMGGLVFELQIIGGKTVYSTSSSYVDKANGMNLEELKCKFDTVCEKIEKHAVRERICQQAIVNGTNSHSDKWFYIDMEYEESPALSNRKTVFGRPDMIAISNNPDANGKYTVAMVELKVGNGSYGSSMNKIPDSDCKNLKKNLYSEDCDNLKLGSGIVSHIVDYMRYLNDGAYDRLREELVQIIKNYKALEIITESNKLYSIDRPDMFSDVPDIYIVSYLRVPYNRSDNKTWLLGSMKTSFYNHLFGRSEYSLEKCLNPEQIKGFMEKKTDFNSFKGTADIQFIFKQQINNKEYPFHVVFFDPDEFKTKEWDCLI